MPGQFFARPSTVGLSLSKFGSSGFSGSSPRRARSAFRCEKSLLPLSIFRFSADHAACSIRHSRKASIFSSRSTASRLSIGHSASLSAVDLRSPLADTDTKYRDSGRACPNGSITSACAQVARDADAKTDCAAIATGSLTLFAIDVATRESGPRASTGYGSSSGNGGKRGSGPSAAAAALFSASSQSRASVDQAAMVGAGSIII
jgi:hypothetical protein